MNILGFRFFYKNFKSKHSIVHFFQSAKTGKVFDVQKYVLFSKATFEIQVLNTSAMKCQGDFRIFQFTSVMRQQKNC